MQEKKKEEMVECRVLCPIYRGVDGHSYRKGSTITVPKSWIEKGTTYEAGHPENIISRPLKPLSEERAELEQQANAPENTGSFDAEVRKREAWMKMNQTAETMIKKDQMEATRQVLESMGGTLPTKPATIPTK
jgi:L-lactate utilization protein LutB